MLNRHLVRLLRASGYTLASIILLWLVWRWFDGAQAWQRLKTASLPWLVVAWILLVIQTAVSALRWQLTSTQLGAPIATANAIGQYFASMLCNLTLPGGVLGDAGRAWHNRGQAGLAASAAAVVLERLAGQLAMILTLALALTWQLRATLLSHTLWWVAGLLAAGMATGLAVAVFVVLGNHLRARAWLARLANWIQKAWLAPQVRGRQLGLTVLVLLANLMAFFACAQAVGAELPGDMALLVLPATLLVMALPISVAGWGVREAAAALIWPLAGIASDAAIAASVAYGIVATLSALPGLWWLRPRAKA